MKLILASASPRRADLLRGAGIRFDVDPAGIPEERGAGETPMAYVKRLSEEKAAAVAARHPEAVVLAADTSVSLDGACLEKPGSAREAEEMLRRLSGRTHEVLTGFTVRTAGTVVTDVVVTRVTFRELDPEEIIAYVKGGEPMDKAGGYGIQAGAAHMVERIDGSYTNVVGLPLAETVRILRDVGVEA